MTELPNSPRIRFLQRCIRAMLLLLLAAFLFILFRSLGGPSTMDSSSSGNSLNVFDGVQIGQTVMRRFKGERVWATRLSGLQRRQANDIDAFVVDVNTGCAPESTLCLISVSTARDGIDVVFSEAAPAQLDGSAIWFGGFVDPVSGAVFDRLGRAYRDVRNVSEQVSLEAQAVD